MVKKPQAKNEARRSHLIIGVCGSAVINKQVYQIAYEIGKEIAKEGLYLVCGGKGGVMEAVCKGAKEEHGTTIGILPEEHRKNANIFVDIIIPTGINEARNNIIINSADGLVFIAGGAGTLSEFALAWRSKKPMVAVIPSGGWSKKLANTKIDDSREDFIIGANSAKDTIQKIIQQIVIQREKVNS